MSNNYIMYKAFTSTHIQLYSTVLIGLCLFAVFCFLVQLAHYSSLTNVMIGLQAKGNKTKQAQRVRFFFEYF